MKAAVLLAVIILPLCRPAFVCCSMNGWLFKESWMTSEKFLRVKITLKNCIDNNELAEIVPCCQEVDRCCCHDLRAWDGNTSGNRQRFVNQSICYTLQNNYTHEKPCHSSVWEPITTLAEPTTKRSTKAGNKVRCKGGYVNEQWLRNLRDDCTTIYGGLRIQNFKTDRFFKEVLAKFENLKTVKTLEGGLWIQNTKGLGKFEYLRNLHTITVKQHYNHVILDGSFPTQNLTSVNLRRLPCLPQRPANNPLKRHSVQIYGSAENLVYEYKDLVRLLNVVHNNGLLANVMVKTFNNPKGFNADDGHANSSSNAVVRPKREL